MKIILLFAIVLVIGMSTPLFSQSTSGSISYQFTPASEFEGGEVADMVVVNGVPIVSVWYGYVYHYADAAKGWQASFPSRFLVLSSLGNIALGLHESGLYTSTDTGRTWKQTAMRVPAGFISLTPITVSDDAILLYARNTRTRNSIAHSSDTGRTWRVIAITTGTFSLQSLKAEGKTVLASGIEGQSYVLYRSTDKGITWQQISLSPNLALRRITSLRGVYYAFNQPDPTKTALQIVQSRNNGTTWDTVSSTNGPKSVLLMTANGSRIVSLGDGVVSISNDNGQTWKLTPSQGLQNLGVISLVSNGDTLLAGINGAGVYRSTDAGATWHPFNKNMRSVFVNTLVSSGNRVVAATAGAGLYFSSDAGRTWKYTLNDGLLAHVGTVLLRNNTVFAGNNDLYASNDNGLSWQKLNLPTSGGCVVMSLVEHRNALFAMTYCGVYRSSDNGFSWSSITSLAIDDFEGGSQLYSIENTLFAISRDSVERALYASDDEGKTWQLRYRHEGIGTMTGVDGVTLMAVGATSPFDESKLYSSIDNGKTWTIPNDLFSECSVFQLQNEKRAVLAATCGIIAHSIDKGKTWDPTPVTGLGRQAFATTFALSGGTVILGTGGEGVYRAELPPKVSASLNSVNTPMSILNGILTPNTHFSPNPVTDDALLRISLVGNDKVINIQLSDVLGHKYPHIFDEEIVSNESACYRVQTQQLPRGVYLCRITTTNGVRVIKFFKQ